MPEVVFGENKTVEQVVGIVRSLREAGQSVLVTRIETGQWGETGPARLNEIGERKHTSDARFAALGDYAQTRYNRVWVPN